MSDQLANKMKFNDDEPFFLNFYASEKFLGKDFDRHQKSWEHSEDIIIVATNHFYSERVLNLIPSIILSRSTVIEHGKHLYRDGRFMRFLFTAYEYFCFGDDTIPFNISPPKQWHDPFKSRSYSPEVNLVHESKYVREANTGVNWLHVYTTSKFSKELDRYLKPFNPNSEEGLMIYGTTHEYKAEHLLDVPLWTERFREGLFASHEPDPSDDYKYQFTHHRTYIPLDHEFIIDWHDRHSIHDTYLDEIIYNNEVCDEELSNLLEEKTYNYNKKLLTDPEHGRSNIRDWNLINPNYSTPIPPE